ncbi:MAG TPA: TolC family protein [Terriglobia bacterium]|nr:TolC family protein [Terriglobia bacterium]
MNQLRRFAITYLFLFSLCFPQSLSPAHPSSGPLTIDQAVAEALEKNIELLAERYNVSLAEARLITARLRPNPVVSLGGDHLDLLGTDYNEINRAGPQEFNFRTDFLLERGGKRRSRIDVAENSKSVAQLQLLNTIRGLVLDVQSTFVDVQLARDNLVLAQENLKALNEIVEVNAARVRAGDLADVELVRTRVAALQFQNAVRQAELRLYSTRGRLELLLGRVSLSETLEVSGPLRHDTQVLSLDELGKLAFQDRPDLLALRRDQARSAAEMRLQIAQGKVDYTVGTEYRRQQGLAGTGNSLGFFFSAPLPVFNRNQGEIERARLEQQQVEARVRSLEAIIVNEVKTAYKQYSTANALIETIEKDMLTQARDVRQITEYSYKRGEATLIEFLDAQRAFNETMQGYHEARAEYARSLYAIDSVSGKAVNP